MNLSDFESDIVRLEQAEVTSEELDGFAVVIGEPTDQDRQRAAANKLAELSRLLRVTLWSDSGRSLAQQLISRADAAAQRLSSVGRLPRFAGFTNSAGNFVAAVE